MSFDIVLLQPNPATELLLPSLEAVGAAFPLGTPQEIRSQCDLAMPLIAWSSGKFGLYEAAEEFAIVFTIPDEIRPSSLHLSLHLGSKWAAGGSEAFFSLMNRLHESYGWQSFAVSDNAALLRQAENGYRWGLKGA